MISSANPPEQALTPDEALFLSYFHAMSDRARSQQLRTAKRFAADWPRPVQRPGLRLVVGGPPCQQQGKAP
jgi:hypothetical protein